MDSDILEATLRNITEIAPSEIGKRWDHDRGACIASTKIGLIVLKHFKIHAEPLSITMIVGNAKFGVWLNAGCQPFASTEEAKASGVRYVLVDDVLRKERSNGYPGHLVIAMRDRNAVLDLGLRQFRRPAKNIDPPDGALLTVNEEFWTGGECMYELTNGEVAIIRRQENPPDWTLAPDWCKHTHSHHEVAKKIIRKVERHVTPRSSVEA
jgi:hypothetical protein